VNVAVVDAYGIDKDPHMPFLAQALDPVQVQRQLERSLAGQFESPQIGRITVARYKPGLRCLLEYDLCLQRPGQKPKTITLLGKTRPQGVDYTTYRLVRALAQTGFGPDSADGIQVPEPVGVIPDFHMWLQCKVPGVPATCLLPEAGGLALAGRIAEAIVKLHQAGVPTHRRHTVAKELAILRERLFELAKEKPQWGPRLARLLRDCDRLALRLTDSSSPGIHRDFYADQVLVDGSRLYLLDFDLYCQGDPGLDVGNFLAHLTEQSLRTLGNPDKLADRERLLEERFVELAGERNRQAVRLYAILSLVRHVYLSTQFPDRKPFTEAILVLCEQRIRNVKVNRLV
jgi:hypothetical protein